MFHALISEAGNFDFVATDENFENQIAGRFSIGAFDTAEEARQAIKDYPEETRPQKCFVEFDTPTGPYPGHAIKVAEYPHTPVAFLWVGGGTHGKPRQIAYAHCLAAAPELLASHEPEREGPDFLDWVADRLVQVHHENPNADFIHCLRRRAKKARAAIAKAEGRAE